jgi:hypothetical protein
VPDTIEFATKPQLTAPMLRQARAVGVEARWLAADEVYGGRELRQRIRELGYDYPSTFSRPNRPPGRCPRFTPSPPHNLVFQRGYPIIPATVSGRSA